MGTVAPPLPRVAAGTTRREDAGHLLDLGDVEQCMSDGIAWRHVDNRELRQHTTDLIGPLIPRACAPEVVHPEEPASGGTPAGAACPVYGLDEEVRPSSRAGLSFIMRLTSASVMPWLISALAAATSASGC